MAIIDVNTEDLPESDAVPAGKYKLRADQVSEPELDKHQQQYIKIAWTIVSPEDYANRKVHENYIPLAGRAILGKIARAAGHAGKIADTDQIVGWEVDAMLRVQKSDEFGEQNRINTYLMPGEEAPAKAVGRRR